VKDNKNNNANSSETGYGRPPVNTRFKKGQSGNPKGRPKGSRGLAAVLNRALNERVVINEGGRRKSVTKLEAAVKQVTNKAASGDPVAWRQLFTLVQIIEQRPQETSTENNSLGDTDQKVVTGLLKRLNRISSEGEINECDTGRV
jgi:Family of unknown function (DUF5681)